MNAPRQESKGRLRGSGRAQALLALAGVAAVVVFGWFAWGQLERRRLEVKQHSFRVLASIGRQIQARVDGVAQALGSIGGFCPDQDKTCVDWRVSEIPRARLLDYDKLPAEIRAAAAGVNGSLSDAYLEVNEKRLRALLRFSIGKSSGDKWAEIDLNDLLASRRARESFTAVFAVDPASERIFSSNPTALPLVQLRELDDGLARARAGLSTAKPEEVGDRSSPSPSAAETSSAKGTKTARVKELEWAWAVEAQPVTLYGASYEVFSRWLPLRSGLQSSRGGPAEGLVLLGLRPKAELDDEASAMSPGVVGLLALALTLMVLSLPILRFLFINLEERLSRWDVRLMTLSAFFGVGLLTFAFFETFAYREHEARFDSEAEELASMVEGQLVKDLDWACGTLYDAREKIQRLDGKARPDTNESCGEVRGRPAIHLDTNGFPYPFFVTRIDETGKIAGSWRKADGGESLRELRKADESLAERRYFIDSQAGNLVSLPDLESGGYGPCRFAVEHIRSKLSGRSTVVAAVPACPDLSPSGACPVFTISTPILSLVDPVLPHGFSFAIVDRDGEVLLHSDIDRAGTENLLREIGDPDRLAAAIAHGPPQRFSTSYYGEPYRLRVQRIRGLGWSVVVLRDHAYLRAVDATIALVWIFLFGLYSIAVLLTIGLLARLGRRRLWRGGSEAGPWLWPRRDRLAGCCRALLLLFAGLLNAGAAFGQPSDLSLLALVLIPVAVGLSLVFALRWPAGKHLRGKALLFLGLAVVGGAFVLLTQQELDLSLVSQAPGGSTVRLVAAVLGLVVAIAATGLLAALAAARLVAWWVARRPSRLAAAYVSLTLLTLLAASAIPSLALLFAANRIGLEIYATRGQEDLLRALIEQFQRVARGPRGDWTQCEQTEVERLVKTRYEPVVDDGSPVRFFNGFFASANGTYQVQRTCGGAAQFVREQPRLSGVDGAAPPLYGVVPKPSLLDALTELVPVPLYDREGEVLDQIVKRRFALFGQLDKIRIIGARFQEALPLSLEKPGGGSDLRAEPTGLGPDSIWVSEAASSEVFRSGLSDRRLPSGPDTAIGLCVDDAGMKERLGHGEDERVALGSTVKPLFFPREPWQTFWLLLWLFVGSVAAWALASAVIRRLFFLGARLEAHGPRVHLLLRPATTLHDATCPAVLDLERLGSEAPPLWAEPHGLPHEGTVVIDHLDYALGDAAIRARVLGLLEALLGNEELTIVGLSDVDPYLAGRDETASSTSGAAPADAAEREGMQRRWSTALARTASHVLPLDDFDPSRAAGLLGGSLADLVSAHRSPSVLGEGADGQWWAQWARLGKLEKLTLIQMAQEGFVNPDRAPVLGSLIDRGILRHEPVLAFVDERDRARTLRAARSEPVVAWEAEAHLNVASALQLPLAAVLLALAAVLYFTQGDSSTMLTTLLGGAASLAPTLARLGGRLSGLQLAQADTPGPTSVA